MCPICQKQKSGGATHCKTCWTVIRAVITLIRGYERNREGMIRLLHEVEKAIK